MLVFKYHPPVWLTGSTAVELDVSILRNTFINPTMVVIPNDISCSSNSYTMLVQSNYSTKVSVFKTTVNY